MQTFSQNLIIRKTRRNDKSVGTIFIRITVNGTRTEFSCNRTCDPLKWNSSTSRLNGKTEEVKSFNAYLQTIEHRLYEIHRELIASGTPITGQAIKEKFQGKTEKPRMLIEIFEHHNKQFEELVGKDFSINTFKKYRTCLKVLKEFVSWKFGKKDLDIHTIGFEFISDFEFYLKSVRQVQHNSAMGDVKKLKKIINICVANEWLDRDPFKGFKVKIRENDRTCLMEDELDRIINKEIAIERLDLVRDIFVFSCYTGLSYSDVEKLKPSDIATGIDGEKWIFTTRTKTDTSSRVPVLPSALSIIEKYKDHPQVKCSGKLLPILSNQKMNSYLKELAGICDINKELTFHCARHTFATTITLSNGVPLETVSKMLGHKNLKTTQHYAKILDRKVSDDMKSLREKFKLMSVDTNLKHG